MPLQRLDAPQEHWVCYDGLMSSHRFSSRLIAAAVALPALIAVVDGVLLGDARASRWAEPIGMLVFVAFVVQTFALAHVVGRWLPNWCWRLGVLCWALVLTNLQLFCSGCDGTESSLLGGDLVRLLTDAFLSAQFDAVIVWMVVSKVALTRRLLLGLILSVSPVLTGGLLTTYEVGYYHRSDFWSMVVLVQFVATVVLAIALRGLGWRIDFVSDAERNAEQSGSLQFSIRHLFLATTGVAMLCLALRMVFQHSPRGMGGKEWILVAMDSTLLAMVSLLAIWAALGAGHPALRWVLFVFVADHLGALLWWLEASSVAVFEAWEGAGAFWHYRWISAKHLWIAWTLLAGGFLASLLWLLRATGYRLVRRR